MAKFISNLIFIKLLGWTIKGNISEEIKKCIIVVAPHTSYADFFVGIAVRPLCNLRSSFLVKAELYRFAPLGWLMTQMGGIPVDRSKRNANFVDQVTTIFQKKEVVRIALAPEGTRSAVKEWKTGFYRMAIAAKVPIVLVSFDFAKKEVEFMEEFYPKGNMAEEIAYLKGRFKGVKGKHPELGIH